MPPAPSLGSAREWAFDLTTATLVGVFMGIIGPFGSFYAGPLEFRIAYWIANVWIGFMVLSTTVRLAAPWADQRDIPRPLVIGLAVAIGAAPLAGLIGVLNIAVNAQHPRSPGGWLELYGQCLAIAEPLSFLYLRLRPARAAPGAPACERPADAPADELLNRLPPRLGRDLLCLQMEDHYVRVHTAAGSELLLLSLKEAMTAVDGLEGMQVHRSYWVARAAVDRPVARGRNIALRLRNGLEAPVSRSSVAKLRAAGWLGDL